MSTEVTENEKQEVEKTIEVLNEGEPGVLSYSLAFPLKMTRLTQNDALCKGFHRHDDLVIPYSTIKQFKAARAQGARETYLMAGERPDKNAHIRSLLDLWGFESYVDYIYTVCELSFLEGLIPVLDAGFLSPKELKKIQDIVAVNKVMIDVIGNKKVEKSLPQNQAKKLEIRMKSLEWCGRLQFPVITGLLVGSGEDKATRKSYLQEIAKMHQEYGHIHEVLLQNFVPLKGTVLETLKPATQTQMLDTYELARSILPDEIPVTVPIDLNHEQASDFIAAGLTDAGRIFLGKSYFTSQPGLDEDTLQGLGQANNLSVQQRFPLGKQFIKEEKYSKKLGQVFDAFRYKIKKDGQEKVKNAKQKG